jgi:hypothetical protein
MATHLAESESAHDDTVWHYMQLPWLLVWLSEKQLYLTLLAHFATDDPYETSVPRGQSEVDLPTLTGGVANWKETWRRGQFHWAQTWEGKAMQVARMRRALLRSAHASCWQIGDESEAMWRLYANGGDGVAIRSTLDKVRAVRVGNLRPLEPIKYIDFSKDKFAFEEKEVPLHLAMHKRDAFQHEKEARMLLAKPADYREACDTETFILSDRVAIPWDFEGTIEEIVLSPRCPRDAQTGFAAAITSKSSELGARVRTSKLARPPSWS